MLEGFHDGGERFILEGEEVHGGEVHDGGGEVHVVGGDVHVGGGRFTLKGGEVHGGCS